MHLEALNTEFGCFTLTNQFEGIEFMYVQLLMSFLDLLMPIVKKKEKKKD